MNRPTAGAKPKRFAVFLRSLAGVREASIAAVPTERARYTAMGGVVFGTAVMAILSMSVALHLILGEFRLFTVPIILAWGFLIINLDRWLMSAASSERIRDRLLKMAPRLLVAVVLGVMISEPLLLGIFNSAIEERIRSDRYASLLQYESQLKICNPVPGTPESTNELPEGCDSRRLVVKSSVAPKLIELDSLRTEAVRMRSEIAKIDREVQRLEQLARQECNGTAGSGLTGRAGEGPNCRRLRAEVDVYRESSNLNARRGMLNRLDADIIVLTSETGDAQAEAAAALQAEIRKHVEQLAETQQRIGLLERFAALGDLVATSPYVRVAEWAMRIFIILIDALPLLIRLLTGPTAYDRIVNIEVMNAEEVARAELLQRVEERRLQLSFAALTQQLDEEAQRERMIEMRASQLFHGSDLERVDDNAQLAFRNGARVALDQPNEETAITRPNGG